MTISTTLVDDAEAKRPPITVRQQISTQATAQTSKILSSCYTMIMSHQRMRYSPSVAALHVA